MKQQKGKVIIELPRIPENAWLFEKRFKNKSTESERTEKKAAEQVNISNKSASHS